MVKETKQDRLVRSISDQICEHLLELKNLEKSDTTKEIDVEKWAQSFVKNCMGYTSSNGYSIKSQETKGKLRPDLIVVKEDKPVFVIEIKKLGFDLTKSDLRSGKLQLKEYLNTIGNVKWGFLSNGYQWKLFDFSQTEYGGIEIWSVDLRNEDDVIDVSQKAIELCGYDLVYFHETAYAAKDWDDLAKEAIAFSPESLAQAILSSDIIKNIAKYVRGEFEYKANLDVLTDRVYNLIENGLDDSVPGWCDAKVNEFQKYIKSQKRTLKKPVKKVAVKPGIETASGTAVTNQALVVPISTAVTIVTTEPIIQSVTSDDSVKKIA